MNTDLGPFEAVRGLEFDVPFPRLLPVRQRFDPAKVEDVAAATAQALEPLRARVRPGMSVAITAGSRGIHDKPAVVRAAGDWLRAVGAEPFVVPAMGSHGGATAEGQVQLLADLGITEDSVGMTILATMETVEVDRLPGGPAVYMDAHAAKADAVLAVNRVKAHTDFSGDVESGLAKIVAIGLGKQRGAEGIHRFGPANLAVWVPRVAKRVVETGKILGGLAIIENAHDRAARIELVEATDIGGPVEGALLADAKRRMATLPFEEIDVAVVDEMGKNFSGAGMDTNVIGRMMIRGSAEFDRPRIANIAVLDVSDASHGNAVGLGLADFVPFRLLERDRPAQRLHQRDDLGPRRPAARADPDGDGHRPRRDRRRRADLRASRPGRRHARSDAQHPRSGRPAGVGVAARGRRRRPRPGDHRRRRADGVRRRRATAAVGLTPISIELRGEPSVRLHAADNVVVAARALAAGTAADGVTLRADVPSGHKFAVAGIGQGEPIRKYNQIIGFATAAIAPGDHVHTHNVAFQAFERDYAVGADVTETRYRAASPSGRRSRASCVRTGGWPPGTTWAF